MATQAFRIVSQYDFPKEDMNTNVLSLPDDDGWSTGHTFGPSKRILHPPKFVRPSGDYDEFGRPKADDEDDEIQIIEHKPSNLGQWYHELRRTNSNRAQPPLRPASAPTTIPSSSERPAQSTSMNLPPFLQNLSRRLEEDSASTPRTSSSSSIPDMLARAPPPLPSDTPFVPPTFTVLGPANKGYTLLERHGWREGDTLGPMNRSTGNRGGIGFVAKQEQDEDDMPKRATRGDTNSANASGDDVADLTLEDGSDSGDDAPTLSTSNALPSSYLPSGRALLTPLPTVLRADNAGVGSKKGTKRVITQSAQALDLLESRKKRNRSRKVDSVVRVGAKALINKSKKEQRERSVLLAYMKES
ncbi:hypothetical protein FRB90_000810 [Tulasnella sp. 427]|nr:hypothetical protein FRB90_000810 [Tulasnella sp. 427]